MFKKLAIFAAALFLLGAAQAKEIVIYHTSDSHGYYFPRDIGGRQTGGFAALKALLDKETLPYYLIDSGDWSTGNYEANMSKGRISLNLMNMLGYKFITVGNHDFDLGYDLNKTLDVFNGDVLVANMSGFSCKKKIEPYKTVNDGSVKIAFIGFGLNGPGIDAAKIKIEDPVKVLQKTLKEVIKQKPNVIIVIAHDSVLDSRKPSFLSGAIEKVKGAPQEINIVFGGHAHKTGATRPIAKGPLFVESGEYLKTVSRVLIDVDDATGKIKSVDAKLIELDPQKTGSDKKVEEYLASVANKDLDKTVGKLNFNLDKYPPKSDVCTDAGGPDILAEYARQTGIKEGFKTDIGVFTIPSVRRSIPAGPLSGRDVIEFLPYPEYMSSVGVPGSFLKELIKDSLKKDDSSGIYSLFSYSKNVDITFAYNESSKDFELKKVTVDGKDLQDNKIYKLYILSNLVKGYFEGAPFNKLAEKYKKTKIVTQTSSADLFGGLLASEPQGLNAPQTCLIHSSAAAGTTSGGK